MTGNQGKPLWVVLTLLLTIVGSSLGVAFSWATGCHYGVYIAFGGEGFVSHVRRVKLSDSSQKWHGLTQGGRRQLC
jgi:hypothetical protein